MTLTGWKATGKQEVWGADADNMVLFVQGGGGGWLMTEDEYGDFELRLEYKMPKMGNSGVGLRSPLSGDPAYVGMEIQLLDDANWKGLRPAQHTGSIYDVVPAAKVNGKPFGEWNTMRIVAKGRQIQVEQNGEKLVDANLDEQKEHFKRHPGLTLRQGAYRAAKLQLSSGVQEHSGQAPLEFYQRAAGLHVATSGPLAP